MEDRNRGFWNVFISVQITWWNVIWNTLLLLTLFVGVFPTVIVICNSWLILAKLAEKSLSKFRKTPQFYRLSFHLNGISPLVPQATSDFGADSAIQKDGKHILVQAKRYSKPVSVKTVQEVTTALAHYGASEGWVVTNAIYTDAAVSLARSNNIQLIDRQILIKMILQVQRQQTNNQLEQKNDDVFVLEHVPLQLTP